MGSAVPPFTASLALTLRLRQSAKAMGAVTGIRVTPAPCAPRMQAGEVDCRDAAGCPDAPRPRRGRRLHLRTWYTCSQFQSRLGWILSTCSSASPKPLMGSARGCFFFFFFPRRPAPRQTGWLRPSAERIGTRVTRPAQGRGVPDYGRMATQDTLQLGLAAYRYCEHPGADISLQVIDGRDDTHQLYPSAVSLTTAGVYLNGTPGGGDQGLPDAERRPGRRADRRSWC